MSFYRSDSINHYKIVLPRESAWEIMNKLGQLSLVHIVPSTTPFLARPFLPQVKRCEQGLQKIYNLQTILTERKLYTPISEYSSKTYKELFQAWDVEYGKSKKNAVSMLDDIDGEVEQTWNYYCDLKKRIQDLKHRVNFYRENLAIIRGGQKTFGRSFFTNNENRVNQLGQLYLHDATKINFKCGVIETQEEVRFQKTVFRITKGNCLTTCIPFVNIFQSVPQSQATKVVFFVLFPAQQQNYFQNKLNRLVQTYCQENYQLPGRASEFDSKVTSLQDAYIEAENILRMTQIQIDDFLKKYSDYSQQMNQIRKCQYLKLYLIKQKEIYLQLNQMGLYNNFLQGQIYVRNQDIKTLQDILLQLQRTLKLPAGQLVPTQVSKFPTHFIKNTYTAAAQEIVQTYGMARYKQANPGLFTTITFPFLFGVMFGDIAHGAILFSFGLYMIFAHHGFQHFALRMLAPHRYLITLMGFFALYCGFIYNDFLSINLNLFGSCYILNQTVLPQNPVPRIDDCVYPFGIDPIWGVAENNLNFLNSLKMKIAVIIGVVHMTLGVFVKASNSLYFKKYMEFFFEFIPQLLFLLLFFGYMDFLIIFKWLKEWAPNDPYAPSIITTMINMPLKLGKTDDCCGGLPLWGEPGNTSQDTIQLIFLLVAVVCIPLMLLPKPLYEIYCKSHNSPPQKQSNDLKQQGRNLLKSTESLDDDKAELLDDHAEDPSQIFVHQMIETIEYVLGCISNTASYLRLWALSLAHSQLSEVFLDKTVEGGIVNGFSGIPLMVLGYPVLAGATLGVLLGMDSMQCFLHTLRLHWVQFQNKFYKGDGFPFKSYSFEKKMVEQLSARAV